jgi:hypothetical protein
MVVQNTSDAYRDVFPIFVARRDKGELLSFEGTGFILSPGVFVTCGHCVGAKLERDLAYGVGLKQPNGGYNVVFPKDLERDGRGADLALGGGNKGDRLLFPAIAGDGVTLPCPESRAEKDSRPV